MGVFGVGGGHQTVKAADTARLSGSLAFPSTGSAADTHLCSVCAGKAAVLSRSA